MFAVSLADIFPWFAGALLLIAAVGVVGQLSLDRRSQSASNVSARCWRQRATLSGFLALFAAIALYGSLVPLDWISVEFSTAMAYFDRIWRGRLWFHSRTDAVANVLLFVPIGFFGAGAIGVDRRAIGAAAWKFSALVAVSAVFSCGLEFAQIWCPARTTSQTDIATQIVGTFVGFGGWLAAGPWVMRSAEGFLMGERRSAAAIALRAYAAVLLFYYMLPLNLTISPAMLYHKLKAGKLEFVPMPGEAFGLDQISNTLSNSLMLFVVGVLAAMASAASSGATENRAERAKPVRAAFVWGFVLAALAECGQFLVVERYSKVFDVMNGTISAGVGGMFVAFFLSGGKVRARWPIAALAAVYGALLLLIFIAPFDWIDDPARLAKRASGIARMPFSSLYWSNQLGALETALNKFLLFTPLGLWLGALIQSTELSKRGAVTLRVAAVAGIAVFAMAIECLQIYIDPHVADMTDVFIATCCGATGILSSSRLRLLEVACPTPGP